MQLDELNAPPQPSAAATKTAPTLEQLLRRQDVWRGHSGAFVKTNTLPSGHQSLDQRLRHGGWPLGGLIEVCQANSACEWWLFSPAIEKKTQIQPMAYTVLINPPALPYLEGLKPLGVNGKRLLIAQPKNKNDFIACIKECCLSQVCHIIFAWQTPWVLRYAELRKLQLSAKHSSGMIVLFRPQSALQHNSPASLRLNVEPESHKINIQIIKQLGNLHSSKIHIDIPASWREYPKHQDLNHDTFTLDIETPPGRDASNINAAPLNLPPLNLKGRLKRDYR